MKLFVINGPSINLLGIREPNIYGKVSYENLLQMINDWGNQNNIDVDCYQSNIEGEIVNFIQKALFDKADGIIINPAAYAHTSIAILDALKAVNLPAIEVHISDVNAREEFRQKSYIKEYCIETISGHGINGYIEALNNMKKYVEAHNGN